MEPILDSQQGVIAYIFIDDTGAQVFAKRFEIAAGVTWPDLRDGQFIQLTYNGSIYKGNILYISTHHSIDGRGLRCETTYSIRAN